MYFLIDGVTQQVHMISGFSFERINFHNEKGSQIYRKSSENRALGPHWDPSGATLEPLGKHLGHMIPKRRPSWLQFHVLRTYRRAAGEKRKAKVNTNEWSHT